MLKILIGFFLFFCLFPYFVVFLINETDNESDNKLKEDVSVLFLMERKNKKKIAFGKKDEARDTQKILSLSILIFFPPFLIQKCCTIFQFQLEDGGSVMWK